MRRQRSTYSRHGSADLCRDPDLPRLDKHLLMRRKMRLMTKDTKIIPASTQSHIYRRRASMDILLQRIKTKNHNEGHIRAAASQRLTDDKFTTSPFFLSFFFLAAWLILEVIMVFIFLRNKQADKFSVKTLSFSYGWECEAAVNSFSPLMSPLISQNR